MLSQDRRNKITPIPLRTAGTHEGPTFVLYIRLESTKHLGGNLNHRRIKVTRRPEPDMNIDTLNTNRAHIITKLETTPPKGADNGQTRRLKPIQNSCSNRDGRRGSGWNRSRRTTPASRIPTLAARSTRFSEEIAFPPEAPSLPPPRERPGKPGPPAEP